MLSLRIKRFIVYSWLAILLGIVAQPTLLWGKTTLSNTKKNSNYQLQISPLSIALFYASMIGIIMGALSSWVLLIKPAPENQLTLPTPKPNSAK